MNDRFAGLEAAVVSFGALTGMGHEDQFPPPRLNRPQRVSKAVLYRQPLGHEGVWVRL